MVICGIALRFACADGEQYETIGAFWDYMRALCPGTALSGVGYGWENDTLCYLIGTENGVPAAAEKIKEVFPQAEKAKSSCRVLAGKPTLPPRIRWTSCMRKFTKTARFYMRSSSLTRTETL